MDLDTNTINENEDDEISLIDLMAVLVRYRKLVIIGTLCVTFLSGLFLFGLPLITKRTGKLTVTYTISYNSMPSNFGKLILSETEGSNTSAPGLSLGLFSLNDKLLFKNVYQKYPVFGEPEGNEFNYNHFIQQIFLNKDYEAKLRGFGDAYEIICKIDSNKLDLTNQLVAEIVSQSDKNLEEYIMPKIDILETNTLSQLDTLNTKFSSSNDLSTYKNLQELSLNIEEFRKTHKTFLSIQNDQFIVPEAQGRAKKLIICFFAAFFVFVFVAFAKNAIVNIKKDPEASKKLSEAWQDGK